jgi:hypothetical protein
LHRLKPLAQQHLANEHNEHCGQRADADEADDTAIFGHELHNPAKIVDNDRP